MAKQEVKMILGIDTASVGGNKNPNWTAAKAGGVQFAILRAAYGTWEDTTFKRDWPKLQEAGIVRGAYLFLRFPRKNKLKASRTAHLKPCLLQRPPTSVFRGLTSSAPSPIDQARAVCRIVGKLELGDLPISLDVEFPGDGRVETGMTAKQLLSGVRDAWKVLADTYGVAPLIYTSGRVWLDDLSNLAAPDMIDSPLWLARYPFSPGPAVLTPPALSDPPVPPTWAGSDPIKIKYRGMPYTTDNWWIHQYQGDAVGCPGLPTGNVDLNRFNPLYKGMSGERVKWAQRRVAASESLCIDPNGKFDDVFAAKVKTYQKINGLVPDGIIGIKTFAFLSQEIPA